MPIRVWLHKCCQSVPVPSESSRVLGQGSLGFLHRHSQESDCLVTARFSLFEDHPPLAQAEHARNQTHQLGVGCAFNRGRGQPDSELPLHDAHHSTLARLGLGEDVQEKVPAFCGFEWRRSRLFSQERTR